MKAPEGGIQPQAVIDKSGPFTSSISRESRPGATSIYTRSSPPRCIRPASPRQQPARQCDCDRDDPGRPTSPRSWRRIHSRGTARMSGAEEPVRLDPHAYTRSDPGGRTFEPQRNLMRRTSRWTGEGQSRPTRGNVFVAWHGRSEDSEPARRRRMWVARSTDDGATFSAEEPAFEEETGACGCCGTRTLADIMVVSTSSTAPRAEGTERDMYLLTSGDHGGPLRRPVIDPWKFNGCPMSSAPSPSVATTCWPPGRRRRKPTLRGSTQSPEALFAGQTPGKCQRASTRPSRSTSGERPSWCGPRERAGRKAGTGLAGLRSGGSARRSQRPRRRRYSGLGTGDRCGAARWIVPDHPLTPARE